MTSNATVQICHAKIYDLNMDGTAYLENVYGVSYEMRENQIWTASFELAITGDSDDKNQYCLDNHYVELFDVVGTRIELFRIISADSVRKRGQLYMRYKCEHALATLLDKELTVEMNAGPGTTASINALLAMQDTAHWQLGTCSFARNFLHYWIPGTSLLAALWQISGRLYDETWQWTFDTTSYPWTLNLVEPGDDVVAVIDYRLNMQEIKRTRGAQKIVNRLYPRGNGAGVDELTIMAINITGAETTVAVEALPDQADVEVVSAAGFAGGAHVYLENAAGDWEINDVASVAGSVLTMDNDLQHTYGIWSVCHIGAEFIEDAASQVLNGIKSYPWKDERYTDAQNLYDAAVARLDVLKDPAYTYKAKAIDLAPLINEHVFQLGELVRVRDNELDILTDDRVTVLKKRDVIGKPQDIEVQVSNKVPTFGDSMGNIIYADDLDGVSSGGYYSKVYSTQVLAGKILLSAVPGGPIGSMPNPPSAAGAYLSAEYIGIHNGTDWITYMDNAARFRADDGTDSAYIRFDPTVPSLDIKMTGGDSYDEIQDALADAAAAQAAADGEIVGFFQDAEPGAGMFFGDIWIDTDEADPLTSGAIYRYEDAAGGATGVLDWYASPTNAVGLVYLNAATAQTTADGKITTFYQAAEPIAGMSVGDFWVDTDDSFKTYVYSGAAWVETSSADALQALADAAQAQSTADGKIIGFYQDAEPGAGMAYGDIWIDTNGADPIDTTCIYRYQDATGGYTSGAMTWVNEPTSAVGLVYLNAATAQATADGKITTFYQDAEPVAGMSEGDWWVDTNDSNKTYVYSGAAWVAASNADALQALADAAQAQSTADGKIVGFYQDAEPGAGMAYGDIWIDTNGADPIDTTCIYRYQDATGGYTSGAMTWVNEPTSAVGLVYLNAATAQATADGKITTFYQDAEPVAGMSEGDWWVDTNDSFKTYVYSGAAWVATTSVDALQALADAATSLAIADGEIIGFYQDAEPAAGVSSFGDIWIDTDEADPLTTGAIYRYQDVAGGSTGALAWRAASTSAIGLVYLNAAGAQSTADGKIVTYYQDGIPTSDGAGDLWVDTNDSYKVYRAAIAGADQITAGEWEPITGAVAHLNIIGNVYISDLSAAKLTAGDIVVGLNVNTGGYIKSANYAYRSAGWKIFPDGSAEFNSIWLRGTLNAADITVGTLHVDRIGTTSIVPGKLNINANVNFGNQSIYNLNTLRGGTGTNDHILNMDTDEWIGYSVSPYRAANSSYLLLTQNASLRGHTDLTLDAQAGDLSLKAGDDIILDADGEIDLKGVDGGACGGLTIAPKSVDVKFNGTLGRIAIYNP